MDFTGKDSLPSRPINVSFPRRRWAESYAASCLVAILFTLLGLAVSKLVRRENDEMMNQPCDIETTIGVERQFEIDVRLANNLTFAQARVIAVAWDVFVGQGGKILHGWGLYRFVIMSGLPAMMQKVAVPWSLYIHLGFEAVSLLSLRAILKAFPQAFPVRHTVMLILFLLNIVYVISFSTLWNATSGYLNPSQRLYNMPDGAAVGPNSVNLCYTVDGSRIGKNETQIAQGPSVKDVFAISGNGWPSEWTTRNFHGVVSEPSPPFSDYDYFSYYGNNPYGGYKRNKPWIPDLARFELDTRVVGDFDWNDSDPLLPFSSSLTFNGKNYSLSGPTPKLNKDCANPVNLTFGNRLWDGKSCLCYQNSVIPYTLDSSNVQCVAQEGFVWGFSSTILAFCLSLEAFFIFSCYAVFISAYGNPLRASQDRKSAGFVRCALDLAAATGDALGPHTWNYADGELRKELERRGKIRFVEEGGKEHLHIALRPESRDKEKGDKYSVTMDNSSADITNISLGSSRDSQVKVRISSRRQSI